jgi:hypothetical protein
MPNNDPLEQQQLIKPNLKAPIEARLQAREARLQAGAKTKKDPKKPDSPYIQELKKELKNNSPEVEQFQEMLNRKPGGQTIPELLEARDSNIKAMHAIRTQAQKENSVFESFIASLSNEINDFITQTKQDKSFYSEQIVRLMNNEITKLTTSTTPMNHTKIFFDRLQDYREVLDIIKTQEKIIDKEEVAKLIVDCIKKERQQLISSIQQKTLTSDKPNAVVTGQQFDSKGRRNICSL